MRAPTLLWLAMPFVTACEQDPGDTPDEASEDATGQYEVSFWSQDPNCGGQQTAFGPAVMQIDLNDGLYMQTPCDAPTDCDVVRPGWNTEPTDDGGYLEVVEATYFESGNGCELAYTTAELIVDADGNATFDLQTVKEAYEAPGNNDEACQPLLEDWERTGDASGCVSWEGTRIE